MSENAKTADEYDFNTSVCSSVTFQYYRSIEYCVEVKHYMHTRRSSKLQYASKKKAQESPDSDDNVIQRRLQSKKRRTWLREAEVDADEGSGCDVIDLINRTHDAKHLTAEDSGKQIEINDKGLDETDEDYGSDTGSIVSGPSLQHINSPKNPRPSQGLCSDCLKLYQKAKKMKARIQDKLLDNDPSSLTCDQWVLLKKWRPRRLPHARGNLLMHVQLMEKGANQSEWRDLSACSRPHAFLERNLRQHVRLPRKKEKNKRKRARDDSQGSRVAKQKRLRSNNAGQHAIVDGTKNGSLHPAGGDVSSPGSEGSHDEENLKKEDLYPVDIISPRETSRPNKSANVSSKQKAARQRTEFKDLLAQLRGNSSMIVRETR